MKAALCFLLNCFYAHSGRTSTGLFVSCYKTILSSSVPSSGHSVNNRLCFSSAWCLRNEGVSSVLLGTSNPEQLTENLGAIQVGTCRNTYQTLLFLTCVSSAASSIILQFYRFLGQKPAPSLYLNLSVSLLVFFLLSSCVCHFFPSFQVYSVLLSLSLPLTQVLPKMTSNVVSEIDHILGNRPYSKKDYRS